MKKHLQLVVPGSNAYWETYDNSSTQPNVMVTSLLAVGSEIACTELAWE